ncbi:MAG: hypothetical protein ACPLRW_08780 [Moorellales bacterium]
MRLGLHRELTGERGFAGFAALVLVIAATVLAAGLAVAGVASHALKMTASDRQVAQARMAADTGIERIKMFLMADPLWSDGSVAQGPVDETSEVEEVTVERAVRDGKEVAVVTSTGRCGNARKTVRAVIETGVAPLVSAYGGGIKQLADGAGLTAGGNSWVRSDVLVNGSLAVQGNGWIGAPSKTRTVYADGPVDMGKKGTLFGDVYATGAVYGAQILGESYPYWTPPVAFPDIGDVDALVGLARTMARAVEQATGVKHYFPGDKVFSASELAGLEGIYFVEGTTYLPGGTTGARAAVVAAGGIRVTGSLRAEGLTLMTAGNLELRNASNTSVALAVAGGDAGWRQTGGGNASFTLEYGALVAGTINGGDLRGSVVLEQNDAVDFGLLAAPVHTARVVSRSELW